MLMYNMHVRLTYHEKMHEMYQVGRFNSTVAQENLVINCQTALIEDSVSWARYSFNFAEDRYINGVLKEDDYNGRSANS